MVVVLGMEPRAAHMLGEHPTTELSPHPLNNFMTYFSPAESNFFPWGNKGDSGRVLHEGARSGLWMVSSHDPRKVLLKPLKKDSEAERGPVVEERCKWLFIRHVQRRGVTRGLQICHVWKGPGLAIAQVRSKAEAEKHARICSACITFWSWVGPAQTSSCCFFGDVAPKLDPQDFCLTLDPLFPNRNPFHWALGCGQGQASQLLVLGTKKIWIWILILHLLTVWPLAS